MSSYNLIDDKTPRDGTKILAKDGENDDPYITQWVDDVWTWQGDHGGPCGWFSGNYSDRWGDYPNLDSPKYWAILPH